MMALIRQRLRGRLSCSFNLVVAKNVVISTLIAIAFSLSIGVASAQEEEGAESRRPQNKMLTTGDRWKVAITYYPGTGGQESPVVILLPMRNSDRLVWEESGFAKSLQGQGFAVVTVDLRMHGKSLNPVGESGGKPKPFHYRAMVVEDLAAVKGFLITEHHAKRLNIRKTAIVAPGMSAPVAMNYAVLDWLRQPYDDAPTPELRTPRGQDVRALVLISPTRSAPGLNKTNQRILELRDPNWEIAFQVVYGEDDRKDKGAAKEIYTKLANVRDSKGRMELQMGLSANRGTDLLDKDPQKKALAKVIIKFLTQHLKNLPDRWQSRESPLKS